MAVRQPIEMDLDRVDALIEEEEAGLEPKHAASIAYRATAERSVAGGVASSWQDSPPHAIFVDHGLGSRLWDIDGNEYVDFHLGYGAMVMGHAHPKIVEVIQRQAARGTHFAQPTKDLDAVGENLVERFKLPLWRFCNSGTEATLEAARLMRANTGRDVIIKVEGSYHGHHDALMFSVIPDADLIGPREHPVAVPQAEGIPPAFGDVLRIVPFNDLDEVRRALSEHEGNVAGMIVEPAMMNCGVIFPEPGYLQGIKELLHEAGAYLAFDEVKTGLTLAYGGAAEAFGVTPDILCLAKALGGGLPCGAIGATRELYRPVIDGTYDMAGTYNGNPLTMVASRVTLTEVMTPVVYDHLNGIHKVLADGCTSVIERHALPAYVTGVGAKGSVIYSATPVREYRDSLHIDERITYLAWLVQQNRGVFKSPWSKQETWTTAITHSEEDAKKYVANFEELAVMLTS